MPEGQAVQTMFAGVSRRYDLANRVLSGGLDVLWRRTLVAQVAARAPRVVVDLATGSGDVAFALARHFGPPVSVTGLDFCEPMLDEARRKQARRPALHHVSFGFGDCLALPLAPASVDALTIAFGLRNLEDRPRGLAEMHRVLRPGGALHILEFSQPLRLLHRPYYAYLRHILPGLAAALGGDRAAYRYLGDSIAAFPDPPTLAHEIAAAGFAPVHYRRLTGGVVALHEALVPAPHGTAPAASALR